MTSLRKTLAAMTLSAVALTGLAACSDSPTDEYSQVCTDATGVRVPDYNCGSSTGSGVNGFLWYYIVFGLDRPGYGTQVTHNHYYTDHGGTTTRPAAAKTIKANVPPTGAPAVKGAPTAPSKAKSTSSTKSTSKPGTNSGNGTTSKSKSGTTTKSKSGFSSSGGSKSKR